MTLRSGCVGCAVGGELRRNAGALQRGRRPQSNQGRRPAVPFLVNSLAPIPPQSQLQALYADADLLEQVYVQIATV